MTYAFERLDVRGDDWLAKFNTKQTGTIYQTPAWLAFLSLRRVSFMMANRP